MFLVKVLLISTLFLHQVHGLKYARPYTLCGITDTSTISNLYSSAYSSCDIMSTLTGSGQIIGLADSGVEFGQCFMYGPSNTQAFSTSAWNGITYPTSVSNFTLNHSHVVQYMGYKFSASYSSTSKKLDNVYQLGTYIASIVNGKYEYNFLFSFSDSPQYYGYATNAKLAVMDLVDDTTANLIAVPYNISAMFHHAYLAGARIYINSWSGNKPASMDLTNVPSGYSLTGGYNQFTSDVDKYMWDHPDFLAVIPSGWMNCIGATAATDSQYAKLGSLAYSKNALVVGGAHNLDPYISILNSTSSFSEEIFLISNYPSVSSTINSTMRNPYTLDFHSPYGPTSDNRKKPDIYAPSVGVLSANPIDTGTSGQCSCDSTATCNNMGTTTFGTSAPLYYQQSNHGSSAAVGVVGGMLALTREYLQGGYYVDGKSANASMAISTPSGALLKAIMIHGAVKLPSDAQANILSASELLSTNRCGWNTSYTTNLVRNVAASNGQSMGFGYTNLANGIRWSSVNANQYLYFPGHSESAKSTSSISPYGDPILSSTGSTIGYNYCAFYVASAPNPKITLVWHDYPAANGATTALINNLDLSVTYGTTVHLGNEDYVNTAGADSVNNVEVVNLAALTSSTTKQDITINVTATTLTTAQPFAIVLTGYISPGTCASAVAPSSGNSGSTSTAQDSGTTFLGLSLNTWYYIAGGAFGFLVSVCFGCCYCCKRYWVKKFSIEIEGTEEILITDKDGGMVADTVITRDIKVEGNTKGQVQESEYVRFDEIQRVVSSPTKPAGNPRNFL